MLAIYCLLSFVAGKAGLVSQVTMDGRIMAMEDKAAELRATNARLSSEVKALTSDAGRLAREARKIGYLKPDETEILLLGIGAEDSMRPASDGAGIEDVLRVGEIAGLPDLLVKEIALIVGFGVFLVMSLMRPSTRAIKAESVEVKAETSPGAETA